MNKKINLRALMSSKKVKYGSVAAGLTAAFIAVVILFNAVFGLLSDAFGFSLDLTSEKIYGITDQTRQLLSGQSKEVSIKFMLPLDQLASSDYYPVVTCAQIYEREFPNVKVEYYDIITSPQNLSYFTGKGYSLSTSDVVVQCGDEFQIFALSSFLPLAQSTNEVYAFRAEVYFTSAILAVTRDDKPEVTFTTNHNETVSSDLEEIFELCGYKINRIDLTTQSISDATDILVIHDPQVDFHSSVDGTSEIEKLTAYLNANRSAMVFLDPFTKPLPNLDEVLEEWGIAVVREQVILDDKQCLPQKNNNIICDYVSSSTKEENPVFEEIVSQITSSHTVSANSAPILLSDPASGYCTVQSVLQSGASSYVKLPEGESLKGPFPVMAVATRSRYVNHGNSLNKEEVGHLLVCSSSNFTDECSEDAHANRTLMFNAIRLMSDEDILISGISIRRFDNTALEIQAEDVTRYTVLMCAILPGIVVVGGVAVWIKRKHL